MLYAIHMGNVNECTAGQKDIVYLISNTRRVDAEGCKYVFSDGHGIMTFSDFYDDLNDLEAIDWDIMIAKYWRDTFEDPDRKRRRQAEFLVYLQFPWNLIEEIGVINRSVESDVDSVVSKASYKPPVRIRGDWYY